jgi:hypothetical protein
MNPNGRAILTSKKIFADRNVYKGRTIKKASEIIGQVVGSEP